VIDGYKYLADAKFQSKKVMKMEEEKDIYTEEGVGNYVEEDEISSEEQGFMLGYLEA
jgi:hypothetical protein